MAKVRKNKPFIKSEYNIRVPDQVQNMMLSDPSAEPDYSVSVTVSNKNFHRAVMTNNQELFQNLMESKDQLSTINYYWSPDCLVTPLMMAIVRNNEFFIRAILEEFKKPKLNRTSEQPVTLEKVNTGNIAVQAFGIRVRKVNMSRGGREGNNAFLLDDEQASENLSSICTSSLVEYILCRDTSIDTLNLLIQLVPEFQKLLAENIGTAVRVGNLTVARFLIEKFKEKEYDLSPLLLGVLQQPPLQPFSTASLSKKPVDNFHITPLHAACINPDDTNLDALLEDSDDFDFPDQEDRRLVHYAAACSSSAPLKLLLHHGINVNDTDKQKITPLMLAAKYNRAETARVLIQEGAHIHTKCREGTGAIHFAAQNGSFNALKVLLENGAWVDMKGYERKTPIIYAASKGWYECVELLIQFGARVIRKDRKKRSPLIHAVKNGYARQTCLLLKHGADFNEPDNSKNYPIHYAAAYGWLQCIDLLIQAGANVNVVNDWKMQPLLIAMLKGKPGVVQRLLAEPNIDVNCKDENGRTLLSKAMDMLSFDTLQQIQTLVQDKQADPNIVDGHGFTALHHLCQKIRPLSSDTKLGITEKRKWEDTAWNWQVRALELMIQAGGDINKPSRQGKFPWIYALQSHNTRLFKTLVQAKPDFLQSVDGSGILHFVKLMHIDLLEILIEVLKTQDIDYTILDKEGFNPLLRIVLQFVENESLLMNSISHDIFNQQADKAEMEEQKKPRRGIARINRGQSFRGRGRPNIRSRGSRMSRNQGTGVDYSQIMNSRGNPDINLQQVENRSKILYEKTVDTFISLLKVAIAKGADPSSVVQKLKKYRENPQLIHQEYAYLKDRSTPSPVLFWQEFTFHKPQDCFFKDTDGRVKWREYSKRGGQNLIHIVSNSNSSPLIEFVLQQTRQVNLQDFEGNTPLLKFCQSKNAEFIPLLIKKGAKPNIYNFKNQGPVHYATHSIQVLEILLFHNMAVDVFSQESQTPLNQAVIRRDLNAVRLLVEHGADPNFRDKFQRTSLHHAFNVADPTANASFELESFLLHKGADLNAIDVRGRTPFHYAFVKLHQHKNYDQIDPIETVSSACSRIEIDVNVADQWKKTPLHYAAQRGALTSTMFMLERGAQLEAKDIEGNTPLAIALKYKHANYASMLIQKGASVHEAMHIVCPQDQRNPLSKYSFHGFQEQSYSMFQAAIISGWQGAAYLMLYSGYEYMQAMHDAMNENKFELVRTLLLKVQDNSTLSSLRHEGQTLFHTLAIKGIDASEETTQSICQQLYQKGVPLEAVDDLQRSPLHYAAGNHYDFMVSFILSKTIEVNNPDFEGNTPLALAVKGTKILRAENTLELFFAKGCHMGFQYNEDSNLRTTPLLNAVMQRATPSQIRHLLQHGSQLTETDSLGRNALMLAILQNDTNLVSSFMNQKVIDLNQADYRGWTPVFYVVQPLEYGTFQNVQIFEALVQNGANLSVMDKNLHTAYHYSSLQLSGKMKEAFEAQGHIEPLFALQRKLSQYSNKEQANFQEDAETLVRQQLAIQTDVTKERIPDQQAGGFSDHYKVVEDYDICLVKVDISFGPYSAYLFYRMQILYDTIREIFVVVTRWGRIGEIGAHQRTPFTTIEKAVEEFSKIFEQKTKNVWGQEFQRQRGKYMLMDTSLTRTEYKDFVQNFNFSQSPASELDQKLQRALKTVSVVTAYKTQISMLSLDSKYLNFSTITEKRLVEASAILQQITPLVQKLEQEKNTSVLVEIKEQLYELSSRYFELIPQITFADSIVSPITTIQQLDNALQTIDTLRNVEIASKIILGAQLNVSRKNPVDYIYSSLPVQIETLEQSSSDLEFISQYFESGGGVKEKILSVFKINRKGEAQQMEKYIEIKNRKLLWHGTSVNNLIGILSRGLLVAPPNAHYTGSLLGKGIYFGDSYGKSSYYTRRYDYICQSDDLLINNSYFMFLCQVVLGEMYEKTTWENIEELPANYLSTLGMGTEVPDPQASLYLNNGIEVPYGPLVERNPPLENSVLNLNEYVVYRPDQVRIRYLLHIKN